MRSALVAALLAAVLAAGCGRKAALGATGAVLGVTAFYGGSQLAAEGEEDVHTPLMFGGAMLAAFGVAALIDALDDDPSPAEPIESR
jgi:hypothetical protein